MPRKKKDKMTLIMEDANTGLSLTDTYIHFEKMYHLLMDADGHQVYFGESAIKNAAASTTATRGLLLFFCDFRLKGG